jgi:hypothetical protein
MAKPKVYIDKENQCIRINSNERDPVNITEAHSFLKDFISIIYDYHKQFKAEIGDYIK